MAEKRTEPVGGRVRRLREERELTQQDVAYRAGLGVATLSRLERGAHTPRKGTLEAIAAVLEVDVGQIIGKAS